MSRAATLTGGAPSGFDLATVKRSTPPSSTHGARTGWTGPHLKGSTRSNRTKAADLPISFPLHLSAPKEQVRTVLKVLQ